MQPEQPTPARYLLRKADWPDAIHIQNLLNQDALIHHYLDWRDPLGWLGSQPFHLLERQNILEAAMAAPMDPPDIAWIRLFACSWEVSLTYAWQTLLDRTKNHFETMAPQTRCFILALEDWLEVLLRQLNYPRYQEIIVLQRDMLPFTDEPETNDSLKIRKLQPGDLPDVAEIDSVSFEDLWIYSVDTLVRAYHQSSIALIAELDERPVAYLLATVSGELAHLARIAVRPEVTRHHIATRLIQAMYQKFKGFGVQRVTLNTQSDNIASLALYDTMGFRKIGEKFNIYQIF